jgi:phosphoribosyl 1,2-cyclic phosphate phosphodiesterase
MKWTILGSGGCMVIPKPLCQCKICKEAREKGIPYSRSGPASFLHDINLLIDTPGDIVSQLNRNSIDTVKYLTFTHLDPDHVEGFRVVEQITLDFRKWRAYAEKQINLILPESLVEPLAKLNSQYGSYLDFYISRGFIELTTYTDKIQIDDVQITAIPIDRGIQTSYIYIIEENGRKIIYAPCDIKPFPEERFEVKNPDLLIIQPGIFETKLKHNFIYPTDHISRRTLYTFEQTMKLANRLSAKQTVFIHLEEYWNRNYDEYCTIESEHEGIQFAYDGMELNI